MNFIRFKTLLKEFPVFSMDDIRAIEPRFDHRRLTEWQAKGYIRKMAKGCYVFTDADVDENLLYRIGNKLYKPSYVSFETALAHYRLIPESVYGITSATSRRTYRFETPLAHFSYRTIAPRFFFGYRVLPGPVRMASPEKALVDWFYLHPHVSDRADYASMRLDRHGLAEQLDEDKLSACLQRFSKKALTARLQDLLGWIRRA